MFYFWYTLSFWLGIKWMLVQTEFLLDMIVFLDKTWYLLELLNVDGLSHDEINKAHVQIEEFKMLLVDFPHSYQEKGRLLGRGAWSIRLGASWWHINENNIWSWFVFGESSVKFVWVERDAYFVALKLFCQGYYVTLLQWKYHIWSCSYDKICSSHVLFFD